MSVLTVAGIFLLAAGARFKGSLTNSGTLMALLVALLIGVAFDLYGLLILAVFFLTSSVLGKVLDKRVESNTIEEKGNRRDARQVLANGGWPAVCAVFYLFTGDSVWLIAFLSGFAAATSDTWASEFGRLSKRCPLDLIRLKPAVKGQSGAVSVIGTLGAAAGSLIIGVSSFLFMFLSEEPFTIYTFVLISVIGFTAQLIDTIAGGTIQALYECPGCGEKTERTRHCGYRTVRIRGVSFINNDVVNHLCTASAVFITWIVYVII
ncbi:DUF92 domain-containing protein [Bacillus sp. H-16]|uniref:DUF92 domain-containing protein n=1 Tax=Alteribacter salitolerans TaxID=2912333 RepID=UPI0019626A30|nr:DUF92 domain-containing protein [Alteribacter salitolerans]MBM7097344.1 DUF92 domain-containing protein [Alteribacter salitolerans]